MDKQSELEKRLEEKILSRVLNSPAFNEAVKAEVERREKETLADRLARKKKDATDRRVRWMNEKLAQGLCGTCGREPLAAGSSRQCPSCLVKQRERMHKASKASKRYPGARSYKVENEG